MAAGAGGGDGEFAAAKTAVILRKDGTVHWGPRDQWEGQNQWLQEEPYIGVHYGDRFVQIGAYRLGVAAGKLFLVWGGPAGDGTGSKCVWRCREEQTCDFLAQDGEDFGATADSRLWDRPLDKKARGVRFGDKCLKIGPYTIGDHDGTHFFIGDRRGDGNCCVIFREDGTAHRGKRSEAQNRWAKEKRGFSEGGSHVVVGSHAGGKRGELQGFLQLGEWRIGSDQANRFVIVSTRGGGRLCFLARPDNGRTAFGPFDGEHAAVRNKFLINGTPWPGGRAKAVVLAPRVIEFRPDRDEDESGRFLIGRGGGHLSVVFAEGGKHTLVWAAKTDGSTRAGPAEVDFLRGFRREDADRKPQMGDGYIQIGNWRIGDHRNHLLISHKDTLCAVFHPNGTREEGPFEDGCPQRFRAWVRRDHRRDSPPSGSVKFGEGFIELGNWRIGRKDDDHLVFNFNGERPNE